MTIPEQEGVSESRPRDELLSGEAPEVARESTIPRTRISRMWVRTLPALIALSVILILVAQNRAEVTVRFFSGSLKVPLSVALLGTMALGAFVVLGLGSARVVQLRRRVRSEGGSRRGWNHRN